MSEFDIVRQYCALPIAVQGVRYNAIVDQQRENQVWSPEPFFKDLDALFGWVSANPSDPEKVELLKRLFILSDVQLQDGQIKSQQPNAVAKVVDDFTKFLLSDGNQFANVVGRRGSGKTALTNFVLSVKHPELQAAHTTWLRADIAKLHAINEERIREEPGAVPLSVHDYMAIHAFSLFVEYGPKDAVFACAFKDEARWDEKVASPFEEYLGKFDMSLSEKWRLVRSTENTRQRYVKQGLKKKENDQDVKWYILEIARQIALKDVRLLFGRAWEYITFSYANQYSGKVPRLLLVFDGVDNIRTDEHAPVSMWIGGRSARSWYTEYLRQLASYIVGGGHCLPFNACVFVIRDDTLQDMSPLVSDAHLRKPPYRIQQFEPRCPDVWSMFWQKTQYAIASTTHCKHDDQAIPRTERFEQFDWFCSEYLAMHIDALRHTLPMRPKAYAAQDVIDIVFNGNIRSFARNLIRAFAYLLDYARAHDEYKGSRTKEDRLRFLKANASLVFEASVLGGNRFMRLNFDQSAKGRWCPNLFEFEENTSARWEGLVLLRVLQSCPHRESEAPPVLMSHIQRDLALLGYDAHCVQVAIYAGIEAGLLCLGEMVWNRERSNHELALSRTTKGVFVERLVQRNVSALYLMATGAKLAGTGRHEAFEQQSGVRRVESNLVHRFGTPRFFSVSVVRTAALIYRHIASAHRRDMASLSDNLLRQKAFDDGPDAKLLRDRYLPPATTSSVDLLEEYVVRAGAHASEGRELQVLLEQWKALLTEPPASSE